MKKLMAALIALLLVATCMPGVAASEDQIAELTKEPVELSMIWWGSQTRIDNTTAANDIFMQKYPNIKITWEAVSWSDYWTILSTRAASQSLPDIIQQDYAYLNAYYNDTTKQIISLNKYVDNGILDLSDCGEASYAPGKIGDDLVAVNLGMNTESVLIDREIFAKAGIDIPSNDWTLDDYVAICGKLMEKKDELGIDYASQPGKTTWLNNFFRNEGLYMYNQDGSNSFGWDKEKGKTVMLDYLNFYKSQIDKGYEVPLSVRQENEVAGPESGLIVTGKVAMNIGNWSNQAKAISKAAGKTFAMVALPDKTSKKMQYIKASQFLSISANCQHPDQAAFYISCFTNDIDMNKKLAAERGMPIASKVQAALSADYENDSIDKIMFDYVASIVPIANSIQRPEPAVQSEIGTALWNMLTQVIDQGVAPETAFDEFTSTADFSFEMAK